MQVAAVVVVHVDVGEVSHNRIHMDRPVAAPVAAAVAVVAAVAVAVADVVAGDTPTRFSRSI